MGYLFIRYTDGMFDITKRARVGEPEEKEIIDVLKSFKLEPELLELESYDTTTFSVGGYTFYLNDDTSFNAIMAKIEEILLKDKERAKKVKSSKKS
jgi:hypothetical protein